MDSIDLTLLEETAINLSKKIKNQKNKASAALIQAIVNNQQITIFAKNIEVSQRTFENWYYGASKPKINAFIKIADYTNIPLELLIRTYANLEKKFNNN